MIRNLLLSVVAISSATVAMAQDKVMPKAYAEGLFFKEFPQGLTGVTVSALKSSGGRVYMFQLNEGNTLPESVKKQALPEDSVANLDEIKKLVEQVKTRNRLMYGKVPEPAVGEKFPDFSCNDINDKAWSRNDFTGKVAVLNVWYSGCGPCIKEMPELSEWKNKYSDAVFLSATYHDKELTKELTEKHGFNWNHLYKDTLFTGWIAGKGYPLTMVVDKNGIIRYAAHGTNKEMRAEVVKTIEACLKE